MSRKLRIGVIGCGEISWKARSPAIAAAENAAHVMVTDIREGLAKGLASEYGVPWTTNVDELLANPEVEAVYISVPHYLHAPLAIKALNAGKHVLVEKPITTRLEDADAMIAKAKAKGLTLSVAFDAQVNPTTVALRQRIARGMLGKITGTRIVYRGDKRFSYWQGGYTQRVKDDWRISKEKAGGGPMIMNTIHDINTLRFLTGLEAIRVYAEGDTFATPVEVEDYIAVTIRYNNGAIGTLEAACTLPGGDPKGAVNRIYGDKGQVILGRQPQVYVREAWEDVPGGQWWELPPVQDSRRRENMMEKFAEAVLSGSEPPVTGWDGRQALEIVVAAYTSAEKHQPVELPI